MGGLTALGELRGVFNTFDQLITPHLNPGDWRQLQGRTEGSLQRVQAMGANCIPSPGLEAVPEGFWGDQISFPDTKPTGQNLK